MSKAPIKLDGNRAVEAMERHKERMLDLLDDPMFQAFWTENGGTQEYIDAEKEEVKKWKIRSKP